ncbi:MAG: sigma-70 family RNA polymerase sigma factor [Chloroflexota bacterium]|nr:sigma-70 family RNA polymerase sigma factor [Chloroflexota bacterium]
MGLMDRAEQEEHGPGSRLSQADFTQVYQEHVGRVYGFVFSQVGNREDAEDLTSQAFLKAYNSLTRFEGRGSLSGWLFQIARATVNDYWRERYKLLALPLAEDWDASDTPPPRFDREGREQLVQELLDRLPANYRDVLNHRFLKRYSVKETALSLGITETNVKVLQFRALRRAAELGKDLIS